MKYHKSMIFLAVLIVLILGVYLTNYSLPIYSSREGRTCDNCHMTPFTTNSQKEWTNPKVMDRKCNLSCLSCHVDPSGGGIRFAPGRYYSNSTLPTFYAHNRPYHDIKRVIPFIKRSPKPEPIQENPSATSSGDVAPNSAFTPPVESNQPEKHPIPAFHSVDFLAFGSPLNAQNLEDQSIHAFNQTRYDQVNADPMLLIGFDLRLAFYKGLQGLSVFPMQVEGGAAFHPIEHLTFSSTASFRGRTSGFQQSIEQPVILKNAFLLLHELPYRAYAQVGLFLPEFGIRFDDHTLFSREAFEMDPTNFENSVYGVQVGMAPNYPYFSGSFFVNRNADQQLNGYGYAFNAYWRDVTGGGGISFLGKIRPYKDPTKTLNQGDLYAISIHGYFNLWTLFPNTRHTAPITLQTEYNIGYKQRTAATHQFFSTFLFQLDYLIINGLNLHSNLNYWDEDWELKDDTIYRWGLGFDWIPFRNLRFTLDARSHFTPSRSSDLMFFMRSYL